MNVLFALLVFALSLATDVLANECVVETGTPTFSNGKRINLQCDANGKLKSIASGGGGAGDASNAEQLVQSGLLTDIETAVDGLETAVASTNTKLDTIDGRVDGLETLVTSTNTKLDTVNTNLGTIDGRVDGLETLICTTNSSLTTIDGRVDGLEALVTSTNSKLDTAITALQLIDDDQSASSTCYITSAASTNATNCKASAGRVTLIRVINTTATLYYLRMYNGVLVYEYDRMPLVSSTIQVTHSIMMGAQAAAVCWGQMAKFEEDEEDMGHDKIYGLHEIRGMAKIGWSRNAVDSSISDEDNGIVNIFVAAVAD